MKMPYSSAVLTQSANKEWLGLRFVSASHVLAEVQGILVDLLNEQLSVSPVVAGLSHFAHQPDGSFL